MAADTPDTLVIYGGSFAPPHIGHDICLRAALAQGADQVLLVPSRAGVHKSRSELTDGQRLSWCAAWAGRYGDAVRLLDWEITGQLSGWTADLLQAVAGRWPATTLQYVVGADQAVALPNWHRGSEVMAAADLLVVPRAGVEFGAVQRAQLIAAGARVTVLPVTPPEVSSTRLRAQMAAGVPVAELAPGVLLAA